ncbi:Hypothetical protein RG1141_CH25080 [Neorhizobium galegae bv. officinalis bv. officinalis str. HAMBI 1141]|jgi:hypothetical protein|uniref:Kazal-like domain-containing protein n=1 Tax=Neorhizobium galegae bv. officinalis bv. officinalis str. HAMBI 1141 TaxID=1028801 RepID=A0A068TBV3_NEOGA|nr:Kazal-type serine protease inhibitor [Neorhizobium galegae]CDN54845.1 Hypothetical protein RG1141_CH25080 [Neorhizobium galegae bv. officinalis bv. officinalis str. HAMBI 1141]
MFSFIGLSKRLAIFLLIPLLSACVDGGSRPGGYYPPERPRPDWNRPQRPDRPDWDRPQRPDRPDWNQPGRPGRPDRPDRPDWNQPGRPGRPDRPGRPEQPGFCTREYRPVCGQQGGRTQTFPNACEAANAGFSVVASGECRR